MADCHVRDTLVESQPFSIEQIEVFQMLWGISQEPACIKDVDGRFIYSNDAYLTMLNLDSRLSVSGMSEECLLSSSINSAAIDVVSVNTLPLSTETAFVDTYILRVSRSLHNSADYFHFEKYPIFRPDNSICGFVLHGKKKFILSLNMFSKGHRAVQVKTAEPVPDITEREWEIMFFLQQHYTNSEIADILDVSQKTVNNHIYRLYRKTGSKGYREFIEFCSEWDLLNYIPGSLQAHIHL